MKQDLRYDKKIIASFQLGASSGEHMVSRDKVKPLTSLQLALITGGMSSLSSVPLRALSLSTRSPISTESLLPPVNDVIYTSAKKGPEVTSSLAQLSPLMGPLTAIRAGNLTQSDPASPATQFTGILKSAARNCNKRGTLIWGLRKTRDESQ